jgi:hypothetical protein
MAEFCKKGRLIWLICINISENTMGVAMTANIFNHILDRMKNFGVSGSIAGSYLILTYNENSCRYKLEEGYEEIFWRYIRDSDSYFDVEESSYVRNNEIDVALVRIDGDVLRDDEVVFTGDIGDSVVIGRAQLNYALAFFDSEAYKIYFDKFIRLRLERKVGYVRSINTIFRFPPVATYSSLLAISASSIKSRGFERIRSCLAKLAIERHICYEFTPPLKERLLDKLDRPKEFDGRIPNVVYDQNLINYYKVGRGSPFASQRFLTYYHVLEYYFLRVSESVLHDRLRTLLNSPSFQSSNDGLDKTISLVRKHVAKDDETEMLRRVLDKFASEEDFISFINEIELLLGEKVYTKKKVVFGELMDINAKEGHAISNAAKLMKHIRNAIVHSSDKYTRDECHVPLTKSEEEIAFYVPIVKYFAEQVIFGTANGSSSSV